MLQQADLTEDEDFVAPSLEVLQHALQQLHLAALLAHLLGRGKGEAPVVGPADEVWVVAVLTHLHEHVVELGHADVAASLRLGHGRHCLLQPTHKLRQFCKEGFARLTNCLGWPQQTVHAHVRRSGRANKSHVSTCAAWLRVVS